MVRRKRSDLGSDLTVSWLTVSRLPESRLPVSGVVVSGVVVSSLVVLLGACGNDEGANGGSNATEGASATSVVLVPDTLNDADVAFAQALRARAELIAALAALGRERAGDQQVKDLAQVMHEAHVEQMAVIDKWLVEWKRSSEPPSAQEGGADVLARLDATPNGAAFDRAVLEVLIEQLGATVPLAKQELDSGSAVSAMNLAERIVQEQPGEIEEMRGLLAELP